MAENDANNMIPMEVSVSDDDAKKPLCRRRKFICCDTLIGCCGCFILTVIIIFLFILLIIYANAKSQTFPATRFTNVQYPSIDEDGVTLHGYLATPEYPDPEGAPAVLVFHAWNGISEEATYFCDLLAERGYYCLAPDLFRNVAAGGMNIVWNVLSVIRTPQERMDADSDGALAYLRALDGVDNGRIAAGPGFCFGGTQSLVFSSRHRTAATVTCYGTYVEELADPDAAAWGKLKGGGPIMGIYGEEDGRPSPAEARGFAAALRSNGMDHNVTVYPGVGHGFVTPEAHREEDHPDHGTAVRAWDAIVAFLGEALSSERKAARALETGNGAGEEEEEGGDLRAVPFLVGLRHRLACAYKCASDHFTHTGHWHGSKGVPSELRAKRSQLP